jgi:Ferritin-like domain
MSSQIGLNEIDVNGALAETAHDAVEGLESGDTRLDFIKKAGLAGGAVMGGGAILSAFAPGTALAKGRPPKSFGKGDIGILNYALTLEYLESAFYTEATKNQASTGFIKNPQTQVALARTTADEAAHVKALKAALGHKAVKSPKFDFKGTTADEATFVATSYALENEGVHAYAGQALNISGTKVIKAALSIITVEARHASVFGLLAKGTSDSISPDGAFDKPFMAKKVLKDVTKLGFIQS